MIEKNSRKQSRRRDIVQRFTRKLKYIVWRVIRKAKQVSFIGFEGVPVYNVVRFFSRGLINGSITTRASAISFDFFIALFPTIIFVFTLIPFIPVDNFQEQLLALLQGIIPDTAYKLVESTLVEVVTQRSFGLLSFGFIAAIFFAHNGMNSLIVSFNGSYHTKETQGFVNQHLVAFLLTIILPSLIMIAVLLLLFGQFGLNFLVEKEILRLNFTYYIFVVLRWLIVICVFFLSISFLYYFAPAKRTKFRFISAGSIMATIMILVTSIGFSYFVNNFGQYNKLYGSIGSLLALMAWIFFNAIGLILGFEINASITSAKVDYSNSLTINKDEHNRSLADKKRL
ncbi:MAG: YihY/virulence factor BrkB family protein [Bacteroidales bacterium]|nr:YihY/virulence factor BrkB family protein [Bacteroidales bacterium]MDD4384535.1 YihY/virulence factor BrkB family protein [Bacteroidales bacterium]MDY0197466.1 YihY/virulence factor BrkB family protein [Tenuifilaceae bacterium]